MGDNGVDDGLGDRLRRYRTEKKLNQAALARAAGISPAYLSELEGGAGKRPSGRVLLGLAEILGVTIADLLGQEIRPHPDARQIPDGLAEFASDRKIPRADVEMLASIRFRGDQPVTARRWGLIYDTIRSSRGLDEDEQ